MWRHLLRRLGVGVHPALQRNVTPLKPIHGIFCRPNSDGLDKGELLGFIPFVHCISPNIATASPWGRMLMNGVSSYNISADGVHVEYPKESAVTTVFCALLLHLMESPLKSYLQWISLEHDTDANLQRNLGDSLFSRLQIIKSLNASVIVALCEDASKIGWNIPVEVMNRAHTICSSRCVDVPCSRAVFGGPAMVPFVDLINHNDDEPNVTVYLETSQSLGSLLKRFNIFQGRFEGGEEEDVSGNHCPFYVIVRAARDIAAEEELHYRYVDPNDDLWNDPLFWASRFHFCPDKH